MARQGWSVVQSHRQRRHHIRVLLGSSFCTQWPSFFFFFLPSFVSSPTVTSWICECWLLNRPVKDQSAASICWCGQDEVRIFRNARHEGSKVCLCFPQAQGGCVSGGREVGHQSEGRWFDSWPCSLHVKISFSKILKPKSLSLVCECVYVCCYRSWWAGGASHSSLCHQCMNVCVNGGMLICFVKCFDWSQRQKNINTIHCTKKKMSVIMWSQIMLFLFYQRLLDKLDCFLPLFILGPSLFYKVSLNLM